MQAQPSANSPYVLGAATPTPHSRRIMRLVMLCFVLATLVALAVTSRWPLVHDAPLIHYVIFLMDHGKAPYRDIIEMNMPGSYMLESFAMHTFGAGAGGWWLWDSLSGLAAIFAAAWIAGPQHRAAGIAAGALAYLRHLAFGPMNWGQRDWIVAVLCLLAMGSLFEHIRRQRPVWLAGCTFFFLGATLIKPPVLIIALCFALAACRMARRAGRPILPLVLWAFAGTILPALACLLFLLRWGVFHEFLAILHGLVPWYAGLQTLTYAKLLTLTIPRLFLPLTLGAAFLYVTGKSWRLWEQNFLLGGVLSGMLLFVSQRKGWTYHLGVELSFLSLFILLEADRALSLGKRQRFVALATLLLATLFTLPAEMSAIISRSNYSMETIHHLEADLNRLGGPALSNNVQCLDMTLGRCINVLYRLNLVQSTGFIYDFYLFPQNTNGVTRPLQERFLREMDARPPKVIVLSAHIWPSDQAGYFELANWPAFNNWLADHYTVESVYPGSGAEGYEKGADGYRIYLARDAAHP